MNTKNTMLSTLLLGTALVNTTNLTGGLNHKKVDKLLRQVKYKGKILTGAAAGGTIGIVSGAVIAGAIEYKYGNSGADKGLAIMVAASLGAILTGAAGAVTGAVVTDLFINDEPQEDNKVDANAASK